VAPNAEALRIAANIAKLPEAAADAAPLPPPWINEHPESFIVKDAGSASV